MHLPFTHLLTPFTSFTIYTFIRPNFHLSPIYLGDEGQDFVRNCYENLGRKISILTKEAILLGLNDDVESREELKQRRDSWIVWFKEIHECVEEIDNGHAFNPVRALTAIAWLEAELFGFEETLGETRRSAEDG